MSFNSLLTYSGKSLDTTDATINMLVSANRMAGTANSICATGRPFSVIAPISNPDLWMTPYVPPLNGLINGLRLSGGGVEIIPAPKQDVNHSNFISTIIDWLEHGPIAYGPIDKMRLWSKPEDRYHHNDGYFIVILHYYDNSFVVHDPEGCPIRLLSSDNLVSATLPNLKTSAIRVNHTCSRSNQVLDILKLGLSIIKSSNKNNKGSAVEIYGIAEIAGKKLLASEHVSLRIGIANRGVSLSRIADLIAPVGLSYKLDDNRKTCAEAYAALQNYDYKNLSVTLKHLASLEKGIVNILEDAIRKLSPE